MGFRDGPGRLLEQNPAVPVEYGPGPSFQYGCDPLAEGPCPVILHGHYDVAPSIDIAPPSPKPDGGPALGKVAHVVVQQRYDLLASDTDQTRLPPHQSRCRIDAPLGIQVRHDC